MVCVDPKHEIYLNRSRSLSCAFSSFSSPSKEPEPKKVGSLAKILSWFSIKKRSENVDAKAKKQKKRALHNLIARLVKKGRKKGRVVFKSSNAKFLCVPSLYLYERFSQGTSCSGLNKSFISRRTASDANVSYKGSYGRNPQSCFIPPKDKVGCYYAVVVDGKQYSLGDFFVKANSESKTDRMKTPEHLRRVEAGEGMGRVINDLRSRGGILSENYPKKVDFEPKEIISKSKVKKCFEGGDGICSKGKLDMMASQRPDVAMFSRGHSVFKGPKQRPLVSPRNDSWDTIESFTRDEPTRQERMILQNVIETSKYRERSSSPAEQSSCCVLKKNSVHKTNLARLGTNLETAHLKKLNAFIRAHRIDSGKLEFKERLALQWVESKGGKMPSALQAERRDCGFQDLSTHNAFFETAAHPVCIEPPVSRFVPHFPQNKKFLFEVKPKPEPYDCRLPDLRERHQEPQVILSFSQEAMPLGSLFVPYTGPKPVQEPVKMKSNLWDLRKNKLNDRNADRNGAEPERWNFKISK